MRKVGPENVSKLCTFEVIFDETGFLGESRLDLTCADLKLLKMTGLVLVQELVQKLSEVVEV